MIIIDRQYKEQSIGRDDLSEWPVQLKTTITARTESMNSVGLHYKASYSAVVQNNWLVIEATLCLALHLIQHAMSSSSVIIAKRNTEMLFKAAFYITWHFNNQATTVIKLFIFEINL